SHRLALETLLPVTALPEGLRNRRPRMDAMTAGAAERLDKPETSIVFSGRPGQSQGTRNLVTLQHINHEHRITHAPQHRAGIAPKLPSAGDDIDDGRMIFQTAGVQPRAVRRLLGCLHEAAWIILFPDGLRGSDRPQIFVRKQVDAYRLKAGAQGSEGRGPGAGPHNQQALIPPDHCFAPSSRPQ